jgi:nitrate reductase gamma subunit
MSSIPFLLCTLVGLLTGFAVRGFLWTRSQAAQEAIVGTSDDLILGLLLLASFSMGILVTVIFFQVGGR